MKLDATVTDDLDTSETAEKSIQVNYSLHACNELESIYNPLWLASSFLLEEFDVDRYEVHTVALDLLLNLPCLLATMSTSYAYITS